MNYSNNKWLKEKNVCLDYEDVQVNSWYAFTLNPSDKYQFFRSQHRITNWVNMLDKELFNYYRNTYNLLVWPEISKNGRLHLHGKIQIISKDNFYIYVLPLWHSKSTVVIKEFFTENDNDNLEESYNDWIMYCEKQYEFHEYLKGCVFIEIPIEYINKQIE